MGTDESLLDMIRTMDTVDYLHQLGYEPERVSKGYEYWYLSPLREERTASFKVNRKLNRWYDFGMSKGGNLIDFGLLYYQTDIPGLLQTFNPGLTFLPSTNQAEDLHEGRLDANKLKIKSVSPLYYYTLKKYLHERHIPVSVAEPYCVQVSYEINSCALYGIGFKNDAGGYELRNSFAKHSSSPKDITTMRFGCDSVQVFEGFMDFLSWRTLHPYDDPRSTDIVVLNGAGMFDRALPFLNEHQAVHLWLDRDPTGLRYRDYAISLGERFRDESSLYEKFKDLNAWLCHQGGAPKQAQKLKLRV